MTRRSKVNFHKLLRDLLDMYPYEDDEVVLVEIIANALDAKCSRIEITVDPDQRNIRIADNGRGMTHREFEEYHDVALSPKKRGAGIGFAGLGAKLALEVCCEVVTETRSSTFQGSSTWKFVGDDLLWDEGGLRTIRGSGTTVVLGLGSGLAERRLLSPQFVEEVIERHFTPLLDPYLSTIYERAQIYPEGVMFRINGRAVRPRTRWEESADGSKKFLLTFGKRKRPVGIGYFVLNREDLAEDVQGVAICTYGKVIKRDWFNKYPKDGARITGMVEVPYLVECLTANKCDFLKTGSEGQKYYQFYREMQKEFGEWLEALGKIERKAAPSRDAQVLERLIQSVLADVPELVSFFEARTQRDVIIPSRVGIDPAVVAAGTQTVAGTREGARSARPGVDIWPGPEPGSGLKADDAGDQAGTKVPRGVRLGPKVAWLDAPDRPDIGWIDGDTVIINSAHPAYRKAEQTGARGYHDILAVATALVDQRGAESPSEALGLVQKFLASWGRLS